MMMRKLINHKQLESARPKKEFKHRKKIFRQIKLIEGSEPKKWNKKRMGDQLFFIMTYHDFRKVDLRAFCKEKKVKIPSSRAIKAEVVKIIWEQGFIFEDVYHFVSQTIKVKHSNTLQQVERIQLKRSAQLYQLCHLAKNLYNDANYIVKETYKTQTVPSGKKKWIRYLELYHQLKKKQSYTDLPAQVAQQVLRLVDKNWKAFFNAVKDWKQNPDKYEKKPKPPHYKPHDGECLATFPNQSARIWYNDSENRHYLKFNYKAKLPPVPLSRDRVHAYLEFNQVRILPRGSYYILEIVYEKEIQEANTSKDRMIALDLGVRNTVTVVNNVGLRPFIVKGGPVKSVNQYFNKLKAKYHEMNANNGIQRNTLRIKRIQRTRNNKINDLFHKLSRALVDYCLVHKLGRIVIGYNEGWKQKCKMGKRNNQNFVNIPFDRLISQIQYKAELVGIEVVKVEESHTSKCSFLDNEPIRHHDNYVGTRGVYRSQKVGGNGKISHGLFKTATGKIINSDVNGAYNILRKAFPKAIAADGIGGLGFVPYSVTFAELKQLANLNTTIKHSRKQSADGIEVLGYCRRGDPWQPDRREATSMNRRTGRQHSDDHAISKM